MIQANEVRLGNRLILSDGSNEFPITVEPHDFQQMLDGDRLYKPIPLTPEILEKCNMESNGAHPFYQPVWYATKMYGSIVKDGDGFNIEDYEGGNILDNPFHYLHQLQNLVHVLTGQELTVNI